MAKPFEGLPRNKGRITGRQVNKTPRSYESHPGISNSSAARKGMTKRADMTFKA